MICRMSRASVILVTNTATGCATQNVANRMGEQTLSPLLGQPVSVAVQTLGPPEDERAVLGQRVMVWQRGNINTSHCTIELTTDADIVTAWAFDGTDCIGNEIEWQESGG